MCLDWARRQRTGFKPVPINPVDQVRGESEAPPLPLYPGRLAPTVKPLSRSAVSWPERTHPNTHKALTCSGRLDVVLYRHNPVIVHLESTSEYYTRGVILKGRVRDNQRAQNNRAQLLAFEHWYWVRKAIVAKESLIRPRWSYVTYREISFFKKPFKAQLSAVKLIFSITLPKGRFEGLNPKTFLETKFVYQDPLSATFDPSNSRDRRAWHERHFTWTTGHVDLLDVCSHC